MELRQHAEQAIPMRDATPVDALGHVRCERTRTQLNAFGPSRRPGGVDKDGRERGRDAQPGTEERHPGSFHVFEEEGACRVRQLAELLDHRPHGDDEVQLGVLDDVVQLLLA